MHAEPEEEADQEQHDHDRHVVGLLHDEGEVLVQHGHGDEHRAQDRRPPSPRASSKGPAGERDEEQDRRQRDEDGGCGEEVDRVLDRVDGAHSMPLERPGDAAVLADAPEVDGHQEPATSGMATQCRT